MKTNSKIKTYLDRLIVSSRRPHSYFFYGPPGAGKEEAAFFCIQKIARKEKEEGFLQRISGGTHPDVLLIKPETVEEKDGKIREKEIVIGQIRQAQKRLKFFPYELAQKFCVIKKAHQMNAEAGNALLKMLEEPAESAFFILLADNVDLVLPTIVSRCAVLRFSRNDFPLRREENRILLRRASSGNIGERFGWAEKIAKDRNETVGILSDWEIAAGETLGKLVNDRNGGKAAKVVKFIKSIRRTIDMLEYSNANARTAVESLMLDMWQK